MNNSYLVWSVDLKMINKIKEVRQKLPLSGQLRMN